VQAAYIAGHLVFIGECGAGGAEGWEAIEDFGHFRLDWLKKYVTLVNGIPRHDTIARVVSRLNPEVLQGYFLAWMQAVAEATEGRVVAIDGKTLRRSFDRASRTSALHLVSAWASGNGVVLGQVKTEEKSNEITAIPVLLELLELKGCIVTLDAMRCQREIARKIVEKKADYVLAVKGNQGVLYEELVEFLTRPSGAISSRLPMTTMKRRTRATGGWKSVGIGKVPTSSVSVVRRNGPA